MIDRRADPDIELTKELLYRAGVYLHDQAGPSQYVFPLDGLLDYVQIILEDAPWACRWKDIKGTCFGQYYPDFDAMAIVLRGNECIGTTALFHEFLHHYLYRTERDADGPHGKPEWRRVDALGIAYRIRYCVEVNGEWFERLPEREN